MAHITANSCGLLSTDTTVWAAAGCRTPAIMTLRNPNLRSPKRGTTGKIWDLPPRGSNLLGLACSRRVRLSVVGKIMLKIARRYNNNNENYFTEARKSSQGKEVLCLKEFPGLIARIAQRR